MTGLLTGTRDPSVPLVSIVLPTYNGSRYLTESMQSCLDQTHLDWELIVVDDASSDASPSIIAAFEAQDTRIHSIRHETNKRLPAALNTGFAAARGEYLTWTSDDNRYLPKAIEEMIRALEAIPSAALVYADVELIDEGGHVVASECAMEPHQLLTGHDGLGIACFLFRRTAYKQIGVYAEDLFLAEDYDYWLRMQVSGMRLEHLHKTLYQYRRHAQSLTDQHRGQIWLSAERALLRRLPEISGLDREFRGRVYLYLASLATWRGDHGGALQYTLRALPFAPAHTVGKVAEFTMRHLRGGRSPTKSR
jgi:glycosyltransferase involved in cell wall biosynthesis